MSQMKGKTSPNKPKRVRWYFKLNLRSEPHEHIFYGEPKSQPACPYLISKSKNSDLELDPFQDVDEEAGWWFLLDTSNANLKYRLQNTSDSHRRINTPRNFPLKGQLSLSLYYEIEARSGNDNLAEKENKSTINTGNKNIPRNEKGDDINSIESESDFIGNADEIGQIEDKQLPDLVEAESDEVKNTQDMFSAYQLPLEDYSIVLEPDLAETPSPPKSKKRPQRSCQVEFNRQKKGLQGVYHIDAQRSEGRTDYCVALFDNDTIVAIRLFVPMGYLPEEFKRDHEEELLKKQTRKIKFLEEDKLVEVHFINNKQPAAYHMSQDGIVDDKVQIIIEPDKMTIAELKVALNERTLGTEGNKKELVKRLTAALNIGTCFKTEENGNNNNNKDDSKSKNNKAKKSKAKKKKGKKSADLQPISEENEPDENNEAESETKKTESEQKGEIIENNNELEDKKDDGNTSDSKEEEKQEEIEKTKKKVNKKTKKKALAKKKEANKKSKKVNESEDQPIDDENKPQSDEQDIMGSPIFPSSDSPDPISELNSSPIKTENDNKEEVIIAKELELKDKPKPNQNRKSKKGKKKPRGKVAATEKNSGAENTSETLDISNDNNSASISQNSSQGSSGETGQENGGKNEQSTPAKKTSKNKAKSPNKPKKDGAEQLADQRDTMEIENNITNTINEKTDVLEQTDQIAGSSSPKKRSLKRKRSSDAITTNNNNINYNNVDNDTQTGLDPTTEPLPKRRKISMSDTIANDNDTTAQSLTQSM